MQPQTDLDIIGSLAVEREEENDAFRSFLKKQDIKEIDQKVHQLNDIISAQIDCTQCGNCCKTLMISIDATEKKFFETHFNLSKEEAEEKYLSTAVNGNAIMCNMPCVFLEEKKCTVYENRFNDCRQFPHLHQDAFTNRLFSILRSYAMCPIVFNVVEELKKELNFTTSS
ncbi:MAG: YkgJ family cysteine cluster protein [Ferruginibacter sp.]